MTLYRLSALMKINDDKKDKFVLDITEDPEIQELLEDNGFIQILDNMDGSPKLLLSLISKIYSAYNI